MAAAETIVSRFVCLLKNSHKDTLGIMKRSQLSSFMAISYSWKFINIQIKYFGVRPTGGKDKKKMHSKFHRDQMNEKLI